MSAPRKSILRPNTRAYLDMRPLVERLDTAERVDAHPGHHVDIRDAVLAAPRAREPVALGETDVEHVVEALRLVGVACRVMCSISIWRRENIITKRTYA